MSFRGVVEPVECVVIAARAPDYVHPGGATTGVLGGGFAVACTEAAMQRTHAIIRRNLSSLFRVRVTTQCI